MKILVATFDHNYYLWQVLVQINNLIKFGYDDDTIYVISADENNLNPVLKAMMNCDRIKSKFFIYKDERKNARYPSSLRPHILEKFYIEHPEYNNETIFYIDPDVVFTKKIDFDDMLEDDCWYLSDTRRYIDSNYIRGKGDKLFYEMCDIVGVKPDDIINIDDNAGGAQYIMKGVNSDFWHKVYDDSEMLYRHMKDTEHIYSVGHPIQAWTSDMWAVLWNAIYFGHDVKINKKLEFCWAIDNINRWDEVSLFHNAGISGDSGTHFSKIAHQISPFNKNLKISDENTTYMYYKDIVDTEKNFSDIISLFK